MRSKKSKQYFGVAIVAAVLFLAPGDPGPAAQGMQSGGEGIGSVQPVQRERQQLVYRPRAIGAPERRVGAGSRGEGERQSSKGGDLMMTVLAPKEIGLTTKPQPTLYWFSSRAISHPVNLIVMAEEGSDTVTPIVNHRINGGVAAGIHQLSLEKAGVRLDPDKNYAWSVEVMVDPDQPSKNLVTTGGLRRMTPPPELQKQLKSTPLEQQPVLYAENGIWYDALEILSNTLIAAQPRNPLWHQQRAELLEQGDLPEVAEFDRHRSGG